MLEVPPVDRGRALVGYSLLQPRPAISSGKKGLPTVGPCNVPGGTELSERVLATSVLSIHACKEAPCSRYPRLIGGEPSLGTRYCNQDLLRKTLEPGLTPAFAAISHALSTRRCSAEAATATVDCEGAPRPAPHRAGRREGAEHGGEGRLRGRLPRRPPPERRARGDLPAPGASPGRPPRGGHALPRAATDFRLPQPCFFIFFFWGPLY